VRRALRVLAFASLSAGGTVWGGWWTVPVFAALWVRVLRSDHRPVRTTVLGATLGWVALLALSGVTGPVLALGLRVSSALGLPPWGFPAATLVYPALLAGTAALLVKPAAPGG
jgi:hypothetical protein